MISIRVSGANVCLGVDTSSQKLQIRGYASTFGYGNGDMLNNDFLQHIFYIL